MPLQNVGLHSSDTITLSSLLASHLHHYLSHSQGFAITPAHLNIGLHKLLGQIVVRENVSLAEKDLAKVGIWMKSARKE
jgi:hypothetical protein